MAIPSISCEQFPTKPASCSASLLTAPIFCWIASLAAASVTALSSVRSAPSAANRGVHRAICTEVSLISSPTAASCETGSTGAEAVVSTRGADSTPSISSNARCTVVRSALIDAVTDSAVAGGGMPPSLLEKTWALGEADIVCITSLSSELISGMSTDIELDIVTEVELLLAAPAGGGTGTGSDWAAGASAFFGFLTRCNVWPLSFT